MSEQYAVAFANDADDGEPETSSQHGHEASSFRNFLVKAGARACNRKVSAGACKNGKRGRKRGQSLASKATSRGAEYSAARKAFLADAQKNGSTFKKANADWLACPSRAALLAAMPLAELKRRRFIPKEGSHNPFAVAVAALGG